MCRQPLPDWSARQALASIPNASLRQAQAQERPMTVLIYVNTSKPV